MPAIATNKAVLYSAFTMLILFVAGCDDARQYRLENLGASSALKGELAVSKDNLGETILDIDVENIADSENQSFVAWAGNGDHTEKVGVLNITGTDGELIGTTKLNQFRLLITTESSAEVPQPTNVPVLRSPSISTK